MSDQSLFNPYPRQAEPDDSTVLIAISYTSTGSNTAVSRVMSEAQALAVLRDVVALRPQRVLSLQPGDQVIDVSPREVIVLGRKLFGGARTTRIVIGRYSGDVPAP